MKFDVTRTSDWEYRDRIEINTIDELMTFIKKNGSIVLLPSDEHLGGRRKLPCIEIYDDWRE